MKIQSTLPALWIAASMPMAALFASPSAAAAPPVSLGNPVTMNCAPGSRIVENGDGNSVSWSRSANGYDFRLYDSRLNVIKQFSIKTMVSTGEPSGVYLVKGGNEAEMRYVTDHLFNTDDLYEVRFTSGDIYNEKGQYLGRTDTNYMYVTESGNMYAGGTSTIREADESEIWIKMHQTTIPVWLKEIVKMYSVHNDFGAPAMALMADIAGSDVVGSAGNFDHFATSQSYMFHNGRKSYVNILPYQYFYLTIDRCNRIIASLKQNPDTSVKHTVIADAYALRAWCYLNLAQRYQFTYFGNESKPCVPLVDENNTTLLSTEGVSRSTVKETYNFILGDLDSAVNILKSCDTEQETLYPSAPKMMVGTAAAYGLRARVNLIMHNYRAAESDARNAIESFSGRPYLPGEIKPGGFTDLDDPSWMWGLRYDENDPVYTRPGVVSFTSHMSAFSSAMYASVAGRYINASLFNSIPETDVRRNLFFDGNAENSVITDEQRAFFFSHADVTQPYRSLKFGAIRGDNSITYNYSVADFPLMRVEEMYYIVAEAMAMSGNTAGARDYLLSFVRDYRNPSYNLPAGISANELLDEIWHQRRIEFWGEGLSFFDLMRLNKGVNRLGGGYPEWNNYIIAPDDPLLLLRFPIINTTTFNNAALVDDAVNNPETEDPTPYTDSGEIVPYDGYVYSFNSYFNPIDGYITYMPSESSLHSGWKEFTSFISGTGVLTIHFDPKTGKVEVPVQMPDSENPSAGVADAYTFYGTEDYADASSVEKVEGERKFAFCLDLVYFTTDATGNRNVTDRRVTWIGKSRPDINLYVNSTQNTQNGTYSVFTDEASAEVTLQGYFDGDLRVYLDILPEDDRDIREIVDHLKSLDPLPSGYTVTRNIPRGSYGIYRLITDARGNVRNISADRLVIEPFPFKNNPADYGEWSEWKEGGECYYVFDGVISGQSYTPFRVRRNLANPDVVNIRLPYEEDPLFNGQPRDYYVDMATGLVSCPKADTGICQDNIASVYVYDLYTTSGLIEDLSSLDSNYRECYPRLRYEVEYTDTEEPSYSSAFETLILPNDLRMILADGYVPPQNAPQAHAKAPRKISLDR